MSGETIRANPHAALWVVLFAGTGVAIWLMFTMMLLVAGETPLKAITVGAMIGWCEAIVIFTFGFQVRKWLRSMNATSPTKPSSAE